MQSTSRKLMVIGIVMSLSTATLGQEGDRVLEWSKQFETIRVKIRRVAETMNQKREEFRVVDEDATKQFYAEVRKLSAALRDLRAEAQELYKAIHQSRAELDTTEYQRALQDYAQTMQEYSAAILATAASAQNDTLDGRRTERMGQMKRPEEMKERIARAREGDDRTEKLKQELSEIDTAVKPGDEVVALRAAPLKAGTQVVVEVRRGDRLPVEQVQDRWLWVRSGETRGWIASDAVVNAKMIDWYQRLPEHFSVDSEGRVRARLRGVLFEIDGAGSKGATVNLNVNYADPCTAAFYTKVMVFLEKRGDGRWALYVNYDHPGKLSGSPPFPASFKGRFYGTAAEGDCVSVSTAARQVFVNGQYRRPQ
ncbi:MAG: hypothetical protein ABIP48_32270 [Planctomycetota bacterium]